MKRMLFLFLVILTVQTNAQSKQEIDSLLQQLDQEKADTSRLKLFRRIGNIYMDNNAGKAIDYFTKMQELAKKLNNPLQTANSYYSIGFCYLVQGDYDKALANYQQSIKLYETLKDTFRLSNALMSVGNVYSSNHDFKKVDEYFDKAEVLVLATKDSSQLSSILSERGNILNQQNKFKEALVFQKRALQIAIAINDIYLVSNTYVNIGLTYKHLNQIKEALTYYDSAAVIYKSGETPVDMWAAFYNNIAATHAQAKNYVKAKKAFDQSIAFALKAGSPSIEMENYRNMADMYQSMNDYRLQSIYQNKYYHLKDSLFSAENRNQLTQLEADYQLEKKNAEIVKKDTEVLQQKSQRNIFVIVAIGAILLLATVLFAYRRIQQSHQLLEDKNQQINQQKDELQSLNQVKDRLFSIISHDLRNPMVTLKSYLTLSQSNTLSDEKKEQFKQQTFNAVTQTSQMLDNLLVWANLQIKNISPTITLVDFNEIVEDAIADVKAQADQKQIQIDTKLSIQQAPGNEQIVSIALRNLLTNAVKFSHENSRIFVESFQRDQYNYICVKDEGMGMTADQVNQLLNHQIESSKGTAGEKGSGLGIFLVKELLQKMNGRLVIASEQGKGASFSIVLPTA